MARTSRITEEVEDKPTRPIRTRKEEEPEEFDYEADLAIDSNYLDAEFVNHSQVFMKYAKESAKAKKAAQLAEEAVKTCRSILVKEANETPDECLGKGIKPTAPVVEAYYRTNKEYMRVKQNWIDAVYYSDLMTNAVFAFQARKSALEHLVRLHGQEYFSTPQEPRDLPDAVERLEALKKGSVQKRIKERMQK